MTTIDAGTRDPAMSSPTAETVPLYAYSWRPYADERLIRKEVSTPRGTAQFVIDPWTQRWAIVDRAGDALLSLADGRRRLSEVVRTLESAPGLERPDGGYVQLAATLADIGLLFDNKEEHRRQGLPVYNASEITGLHLEITNACNMTCAHCYVSSGRKLPGELTLEEIFRAVDMLPPFSDKKVAISGGEPVVRKDLLRIVEYCALTCGHQVDLYTNGWKFPEKIARALIDLNHRSGGRVRLQVSLEGASPRTHDRVRGLGSFQEANRTLEMFRRVGLNRSTVIFVCLTKHNIHELEDIISVAETHDVAMLAFSQWQRQGNASDTPWASIAPSVEEWVGAGETLLRYDNPRLKVMGNFFGDLRNAGSERFSLDAPLFPKHLYFYNAFPRVAPDGDVWADQLWVDPDWVLGNVRTDELETCFETPKFHEQLLEMRERIEHVPDCQACEWRELCSCGSPGHTYAEYGHMRAKDLFCESRIYWFNRYVEHQVQAAFSEGGTGT
jgi:radical SAM protein with 4Fe4S-binding SPASM domain